MSVRDQALKLALRGGIHLTNSATPTTLGVRFPESSGAAQKLYGPDLYQGASGVGLALLDLFHATGDESYARLAREVSYDLIESAPARPPFDTGLYSGCAGIALYQLAVARTLEDERSWHEAHRLALELMTMPFQGADLISGAAGLGLFFLHIFEASREERYLDAARQALRFLKEIAVEDGAGVHWKSGPLPPGSDAALEAPQTGLAHGAAGVCFFLIQMASASGEDQARGLHESGLRWLERQRAQRPGGAFWPVSIADSRLRYHWCHGSTGIGQTYLALHRKTGDPEALRMAEEAAKAALSLLPPDEPLCHCHGLSGIIEFFLDLEEHGAGSEWVRKAGELLPRIENAIASNGVPASLGTEGTSLALGTAGVVRALLRLAGQPAIPVLVPSGGPIDLPFAEHPPAVIISKTEFGPSRLRSSSAGKELSVLVGTDGIELLPRLAEDIPHRKAPMIAGPPDEEEAARILEALTRRRGNRFYLDSVRRIVRASDRLERKHREILVPGVLGPKFHGSLLREIAGMNLAEYVDGIGPAAAAKTLTAQHIRMLEIFLERLAVDRRGILASEADGRILRLEALSSDPHRGGQRVIAVTFESGQTWIYKSRGVAPERLLVGSTRPGEPQSLAEMINARLRPAVPGGRLPTHRIIAAGLHHGYTERLRTELTSMTYTPADARLENGSPADALNIRATQLRAEDEPRFWYSAGLLAGMAVGLGFFDLHQENLVCGRSDAAPFPALHPIDLEVGFSELECLLETHLVDLTPIEQPDLHARGLHIHEGLDRAPKLCGTSQEAWVLRRFPGGLELKPGFWAIGKLDYEHLVRNHDGSFGYEKHLCVFLKGIIDLWETLKEHEEKVEAYLRDGFFDAPIRLLLRATGQYAMWFRKKRALAYPSPGASHLVHRPEAEPLLKEEMDQLENYDIPYFFRYLGRPEGSLSGVRWFKAGGGDGPGQSADIDKVPLEHDPFWRIVGHQTQLPILARSLADAISYVAPEGVFDLRDEALGVRVFRTGDDPRIWFVALLRDRRLTCRIEGQGGLEMWTD